MSESRGEERVSDGLTLGEALVGQGHLTRMQVEIEAGEDSHQGGNGNEAVGNAGLEGRGETTGYMAMPSQWVNTLVFIHHIFSSKNTKIINLPIRNPNFSPLLLLYLLLWEEGEGQPRKVMVYEK